MNKVTYYSAVVLKYLLLLFNGFAIGNIISQTGHSIGHMALALFIAALCIIPQSLGWGVILKKIEDERTGNV